MVDDIPDAEEIVVKPLQPQLKGIAAFAGATIMGDGTVALILDVPGLAQRAGVASGAQARTAAETAPAAPDAHRETVLLFAANDGRMAVPLVEVTRLEEVPRSAVERAAGRDVVQYCGEILPLVHVSTTLGRTRGEPERNGRPAGDAETLQVVVHSGTGRRVGLVVDAILDIGDVTVTARTPSDRPGVLFTAVVQERVTEFLDVAAVLRAAGAVPAAEPDAAWG